MTYLAVGSLFLAVAALLVIGGVISAPFLFGLFLLALAGRPRRAQKPHGARAQPSINTRRWRNGS